MASEIILIRHGETEWSKNGRHTSTTDLPLTDIGEQSSLRLGDFLKDLQIDHIFCSPRERARKTAMLALNERVGEIEIIPELVEWSYGDYEGLTSPQIHETNPHWDLWSQGAPGGEKPGDVESRLVCLFERLEELSGTVACFAHGHILRAFGSLWVSGGIRMGAQFRLGTAAVSILGYEHEKPAIVRWNINAG